LQGFAEGIINTSSYNTFFFRAPDGVWKFASFS
jgi:hypothetical protein